MLQSLVATLLRHEQLVGLSSAFRLYVRRNAHLFRSGHNPAAECTLAPQEEEDRQAATAADAEASLQRRFRELEAAEAAAAAEEAAAVAESHRGRSRGLLGGWFGGSGSSQRSMRGGSNGAAAAAAAAASSGGLPRAHGRGPRSARSRRGPSAEAEFANGFAAAFLPPFHLFGGFGGGGRGGYGAGAGNHLQQLMVGLQRGLPPELLFRWVPRWAWACLCLAASAVAGQVLCSC